MLEQGQYRLSSFAPSADSVWAGQTGAVGCCHELCRLQDLADLLGFWVRAFEIAGRVAVDVPHDQDEEHSGQDREHQGVTERQPGLA